MKLKEEIYYPNKLDPDNVHGWSIFFHPLMFEWNYQSYPIVLLLINGKYIPGFLFLSVDLISPMDLLSIAVS